MAVELVRHSDSRLDRQQLAALHEQLPARRAADDRRALGVAEHAEAGAHREPPAPGRRDARRRARRGAAADAYVSRIDATPAHGRPPPLPPHLDTAFVVQLLQRAARVRPAAVARSAPPSRRTSRAHEHDRRGRDPRRAPAPGRRRRCRSPTSITSLRLCSTLDWREYFESVSLVEQVLQRDPAGRLRPHGLPEPRPAAPGGRGARRADRRGAGARRAAGGRERARRPPTRRRSTDRAAHVGYHLIGDGPAAISRPTSPTARGSATRFRRLRPRARDASSTSARSAS